MKSNYVKATLKIGLFAAAVLLIGAAVASAQSVDLTAGEMNAALPDGQTVPMWGYSCGAATGATCIQVNPSAGANWSPVLITVPSGTATFTINLTNHLPAAIPTSLVIVGQLGGGLGLAPTRTPSPPHADQGTTWPIVGAAGDDPTFTPPPQADRVRSFGTEVAGGATTALTWNNLRPGTYLIESGTHPSIQGPMGLYGMLVVTNASASPKVAYPGVNYDAEVPLLLSEIDPAQNAAVDLAVHTAGFSPAAVWNGQTGHCGDPSIHNCYPPAVNYDPRYYLVNGGSLDNSNLMNSVASAGSVPANGKILLRFVNAGLRMHVPSVVGALTDDLGSGSPVVVSGFSLIAEDGHVLPGVPRVQNEVMMVAGKTYDVMINAPAAGLPALPMFDRALSLSTNNQRNGGGGGMAGFIGVNGSLPAVVSASAVANDDPQYFRIANNTLNVSDAAKGVIANDVGVYGVQLVTGPAHGTLTLNPNGTFVYVADSSSGADSFVYQANGDPSLTATVTLAACGAGCLGAAPTANPDAYTSSVASQFLSAPPGVLANDTDPGGHPLRAVFESASGVCAGSVALNSDGSFTAGGSPGACTINYHVVNSQNTASNSTTATVTFPTPSNLHVSVVDAKSGTAIFDYRWIIEEDRTFKVNPGLVNSGGNVPSLGTSFHSSHMPTIATGCTGTISCEAGQTMLDPNTGNHVPAVCDVGNGVCRPGPQHTPLDPSQVALDPNKYYYISILPGDAADPFNSGYAGDPANCGPGECGHGMAGAPITPLTLQTPSPSVVVRTEKSPYPVAKISVFVFQDDNPLNGENDAGGGVDVLAPNEPGLGGFELVLLDAAGGLGDTTGQITYDMFNMPVSNALANRIDPATGLDACPISPDHHDGLVGMIVTCPTHESDGTTLSPLAGQAVIDNLYPGLYEVVATPGADRIARGEEWLQTNTLDGGKPIEAFIRPGEPEYFQEFGPAGYHVAIGFANPAVINARKPAGGTNTITGRVTTARISRTPDQRLFSSGSYDGFAYTQCYVSLGDPDGEDFAFTKCNDDGTFTFNAIPDGTWKLTVFDQWNDVLVDGLSTPVLAAGGTVNMGDIPMQGWRTNLSTRTFLDTNGNGVSDANEPGLSMVPINIRYRDGSFMGFNSTDLDGNAGFNEVFPFFNWLVLEADTTRYKQTGVHVVYDAGGPADYSPSCGNGSNGNPLCGTSSLAANLANTHEAVPLPSDLRVPGARYCADADCPTGDTAGGSTGRVDPPWMTTEGWQGFIGNYEFVEFGKKPFAPGENGGINGHVIYFSTRPFDDQALNLHLSWEPGVPNVTVNLYQEGIAADGTKSLTLVDTTKTSSWDDWAQGFHLGADGVTQIPNMNCPGQDSTSPFYFTLRDSQQWLNPGVPLPYRSQFKCYDGLSNFNQVQPAPYDGKYEFPSIAGRDPVTGRPVGGSGSVAGTDCKICVANPTDGLPMLPAGKYVVEIVVPPGYELVKEEDKNILIGDNYIAPVTQQFGGLGSVFILPDQAEVNAYNPYNPQNPTLDLGAQPRHEGDTGVVETFWPCVGQPRIVPDYISEFPQSKEVSPFAGATRNLCDRKEVTLEDQMRVLAKFYVFGTPHKAGKYTGIITDDFASEFDPFSPQFGEKFAVPNLPVSFKDFNGVEISRTYSDQWGIFNGLTYSTWSPNPPNPTGYAPQVMIACMNDPGANSDQPDIFYDPDYSQFCYEIPFMPGQTFYMDTPVVPTAAFAEAYNPADCAYPEATPAIASVLGDSSGGGSGPWVSAAGHSLTINALGDVQVSNYPYSGPAATASPFNEKFVMRHFGFGGTMGTVTIGGITAAVTSWSDMQITATVPAGVPDCAIQQRGQPAAQCGELVITAANGRQSIDAVTITVGGKPPTYINGENLTSNAIQLAIDNAAPGDLIIVGPGIYDEMVIMWKPVRLQGVGAGSVTINANAHPAGKLDPWRKKVVCLFGLDPSGRPAGSSYNGCNIPAVADNPMQVDRVPFEGILGWDTTTNANLAELLQEPTLMGAYEGAGITVLGKGARFPAGLDPFQTGAEAAFPDGTLILTNSDQDCNDFPSNFLCNPSRIDGISITNSSQGGGAIFLHGWNHKMQISNNRIYANAGTLSGGIVVGNGEFADPTLDPTTNQQLPYGLDTDVMVHHNMVVRNASYGDELYSATPSAAGGVTFLTGSDNYHFNYNWVCGNLSTGDGGGVVHSGFSVNGDISHNWILFNQSQNPTIPTHGGGIAVLGTAPDRTLPDGTECGSLNDADCVPGLSEGTGPGLVIDANLILGNTAESGSGGGIRLQGVNGQDVGNTPTRPDLWNSVAITNNMIANNVAGWDGGGVSMQDALKTSFVNNTVASNDATASAGVLFNTIGAPLTSGTPPECNVVTGEGCTTTSTNQVAGLVTMRNSLNLTTGLPATVDCPSGYGYGASLSNGSCRQISLPLLANNLFWQNRAFHIEVGDFGSGLLNQQHVVGLVPTLNQTSEGQCVVNPAPNYWDIGVRGDTGPADHSSTFTLSPSNSILTSFDGGYSGNGNLAPGSPGLARQYCNGSRVPPENGGLGFNVDPGIADATLPNPVFNLTPSATVDEGNNWINMSYGPLSLTNLIGFLLGNYDITSTSAAINQASGAVAPDFDFFGNPRPHGVGDNAPDIGAVEFQGVLGALPTLTSINPDSAAQGSGATPVTLSGADFRIPVEIAVSGSEIVVSDIALVNSGTITAVFTIGAGASGIGAHSVTVMTPDGTTGAVNFTVTPASVSTTAKAEVWRPLNGIWYTLTSTSPFAFTSVAWGQLGDIPTPGDYDGDGVPDYAVFRPSSGTWFILPGNGSGSYTAVQWGLGTDIPMPGDYDGDGRTDIAVWRPSEGVWYVIPSASPAGTYTATLWGLGTDYPVARDYDGDGITDIAVWRPSEGVWYILPSATPGSYTSTLWGLPDDIPAPADYDGDNMADITIWRPSSGEWYILPSAAAPGTFTTTLWGLSSDVPTPGDFDGDGMADIAIFRPGNGIWYVLQSGTPGSYTATPWGLSGDVPISSITNIIRLFR